MAASRHSEVWTHFNSNQLTEKINKSRAVCTLCTSQFENIFMNFLFLSLGKGIYKVKDHYFYLN